MSFDDRLSMFVLGCSIGLVVGYIVRLLQEILRQGTKRELEVDKHDRDAHHAPRDENGFMKHRVLADVMMATVLVLTVWAAFSTQRVNNDLKETQSELTATQERIEHIVYCTRSILGDTVEALNERTTYSGAQDGTNVQLQKAQAEMLRILLHKPPYSEAERDYAAQTYFKRLLRFVSVSEKQAGKTKAFKYPTMEDFESCLDTRLPTKE